MGRLQYIFAGLGIASFATLAACSDGGGNGNGSTDMATSNSDMKVCDEYKDPKAVTPPALYFQPDEPEGTKAEAKYSCLGSFKDPDIADPDPNNDDVVVEDQPDGKVKITIKGRIRDFQDDQPVANADIRIYLTADDVLQEKPLTTLIDQQKAAGVTDPKLLGTAAANDPNGRQIGEYTISYTLPNRQTTRIIMGNRDGRAIDSGNRLETIKTYEFFRSWRERNPVAIKLATKEAIPGLVSVVQRDGLGVLAGSIRDCEDGEVGGAIVQVTGTNNIPEAGSPSCADGLSYDGRKQDQIFYFTKVGGSTLPTRVQKWTSGNGSVAALNVPPGLGRITVQGIVGSGALREINSAEVPVLADSVTIVDLPPK